MAHLFHLTAVRLRKGSIIEPGNWGRMLNRYEHKQTNGSLCGNVWVLTRELCFEVIRKEIAQERPSRLSACYAVDDIDTANRYRAANDQKGLQVMHLVEMVDETLPRHRGSLNFLAWPEEAVFMQPTFELARRYWSGEEVGDMEIVTASALRVVECLE